MRDEQGWTLIELLVASTIMILVLGATLTLFEQFVTNSEVSQDESDSASAARNTLDLMARQMRNHGAAAPDQQLGIEKAEPYDVVFQTVDQAKPAGSANAKNVRRVRYCLDWTNPGNALLYTQSQTWTTAATPPAPATVSCPDPAWSSTRMLVDHIVNRWGGQNRPVWIPNDPDLSHVSAITTRLYLDRDATLRSREQVLDTTVAFRNGNQPPRAQFSYVVNANGSIVVNATGSFDPEGGRITFQWFSGTDLIGQGLTFTWEDAVSGSNPITLTVSDSSGLFETISQTVNVP